MYIWTHGKGLCKLSLTDPKRILNAYPSMLSGSTNQRVALAMAMVMEAKLIFADEPTSRQDVTVQVQIVKAMLKLREKYNTAFLIVTHDMGVVARISDKVGVLYKNSLVEWVSRDEIIYEPSHPYTKRLLSCAKYFLIPERTNKESAPNVDGAFNLPTSGYLGCRFANFCPNKIPRCEKEAPKLRQIGNRQLACHKVGI